MEPAQWATIVPAVTALIVALTGLAGAVLAVWKSQQAAGGTAANKTALGPLTTAAWKHEERLDAMETEQAKLRALTGLPSGTPP